MIRTRMKSEDEIYEEGQPFNVGNTDEKDKQIKLMRNKKEN